MKQNVFYKWVGRFFAVCFATALLHLISTATVDRTLQYKHLECRSEKIPPALDGYTAAFLTDIHGTPLQELNALADALNTMEINLLLLGGDFPAAKQLPECLDVLSAIHAPDGCYSVEGNHDDADTLREALRSRSMHLLENSGVRVREGLYLAGVEDLWNRVPDVEQAVEGKAEGDFTLLLSHNPDVAALQDLAEADLTLCGHTHGGEVTLFGLWGPAMRRTSAYGQRFRSGWCRSDAGTDVYVSNGVGKHFILRVFAPPQVIVLTLRSGG